MNSATRKQKDDVIDNKYRIVSVLGEGGMGVVYRAVRIETERPVAVKQLHQQYAHHPEIKARFEHEARAAGRINHDNVCDIIDVGEAEDGAPYLVMPLLEGASFGHLLNSQRRFEDTRIVDIMCQTLDALQAAHDRGIIHRDLKPDNIFITRMGDRSDFVKLLDFGIAKTLSPSENQPLTMTGTVIGTPHYMPPEQVKGQKQIDARLDIYAVGVILFEAFTGRRPFDGDSYSAVLAAILTEELVPPSKIVAGLPSSLEKIIMKAMAKFPEDRFQSAAEMKGALARVTFHANNSLRYTSIAPTEYQTTPPTESPAETQSSVSLSTMSFAVSSRHRRRISVVVGLVAVAAIAAVWVGTRSFTNGKNAEIQPVGSAVSPPPPSQDEPVQQISIILTQLPPNAKVTFNGIPRTGNPFLVQKSTDSAQLLVIADGFAPFETGIVPDKSKQIDVLMAPLPQKQSDELNAPAPPQTQAAAELKSAPLPEPSRKAAETRPAAKHTANSGKNHSNRKHPPASSDAQTDKDKQSAIKKVSGGVEYTTKFE
ncbi:MAG: serine/threonine protein kinase [Deltaproteobacteria bacterium]|nr:serine/threonine protein kinase [Deltaproteobacteria bacterium]